MSAPEVSVIIPTYNHGHFISNAICSVFSQSFSKFEIIVVDDGSTDDTKSVVSQFVDKRLRYIFQENHGNASARNTGIKASRGNYIALLDADDTFLPDKLSQQVEAFRINPNLSAVFTGWNYINEQGEVLKEVRAWELSPMLTLEYWLADLAYIPSSILIRHQVFNEIGYFDEKLFRSEDFDFFLRMAASGYLMDWCQNILCNYRIHQTNISKNDIRLGDSINVLDHLFASYPDIQVKPVIKRQAYINQYLKIACVYYLVAKYQEAQNSILRACAFNPLLCEGDPPPIISTIKNWALDPRIFDKIKLIDEVFRNLPPKYSHLSHYSDRVKAAVYMDLAFQNYSHRQSTIVIKNIFAGIKADPAWLRNRGVWSIYLRSLRDLIDRRMKMVKS